MPVCLDLGRRMLRKLLCPLVISLSHAIEENCFQKKRPRRGKGSKQLFHPFSWRLGFAARRLKLLKGPGWRGRGVPAGGWDCEHCYPHKETGKGLGEPFLNLLLTIQFCCFVCLFFQCINFVIAEFNCFLKTPKWCDTAQGPGKACC